MPDELTYVDDPKKAGFRIGVTLIVATDIVLLLVIIWVRASDHDIGHVPSWVCVANAIIYWLTFVVVSFQKKRTIVFDAEGFRISAVSVWGARDAVVSHKWREVTGTGFTVDKLPGGVLRIGFGVSVGDRKIRMFARDWFNEKEFGEMLRFLNDATPHLGYELQAGAVNGVVIEETMGQCKVARRPRLLSMELH